MTSVSTHVLDTATGRPAEGVPVELARRHTDGEWHVLGRSRTDADGRCRDFPAVKSEVVKSAVAGDPAESILRLTFATDGPFFPEVSVVFEADPAQDHYHVPLLLSPYGYSVYRGS